MSTEQARRGEDALNLPAVPPAAESDVIEGVVVADDDGIPAAAAAPVRLIRTVRVAVSHDRARVVWRNGAYVPIGLSVVVRRVWESRTTSVYDRNMRRAEREGDKENALEWEDRRARFRKDRHDRRMDTLRTIAQTVMLLPKLMLGLFALLVAAGILTAAATRRAGEMDAPFLWVAHAAEVAVLVVSVTWGPLVLAAPWVCVGALWWVGRQHARAGLSGWSIVRLPADAEGTSIVTADTIVLALQNMPIPDLKRAFKEGWRPSFHLSPVRDGLGYSAVFTVPLGVTAEHVADKNPVFARNLHRSKTEVWPTDAERSGIGPAGTVAVWVADSGALSKPAPEYPLTHEGTADVFEGVPGGVVARGDGKLIPIVGNNGVLGGLMGQGKSNAARVIMLGCALDPLCRIEVFTFANNGDFDAYEPRLSLYRKGLDDATIGAAVTRLGELYEEVGRREARLAELGAKKVTRALAEEHPDLRPIVLLLSECHELFGHELLGEAAGELAVKMTKRSRKTAIVLWDDTQSSRKAAIPPQLVELVSVNVCFAVKSWRSNDGFLGDGSFAAGIRATELRPGRDRGRSLVTGISAEQFELLAWYFIAVDDDTGYDAAAEVIARAMAIVDPRTLDGAGSPAAAAERRDLLDDLAEVTGAERVKLRDAVGLLRTLAPTWGRYRNLTAKQLGEDLADEGVRVVNSSGTPYLDPADLRRVLAERGE
jgi:S-DNA-T family DNA segregation ATPase FtsK/SpoIIIE